MEQRITNHPERDDSIQTALAAGVCLLSLFVFCYIFWRHRYLPALGTDALIYHLTVPVIWLKEGVLTRPSLPFCGPAAEYQPRLFEMIAYGFMWITGDGAFAWLIHPLFLLGIHGMFFLTTRRLGLDRATALFLTAVFVLFSPFVEVAKIANNDLLVVFGVAVWGLGMLMIEDEFGRGVIVSCAGLAVSLASKYSAVPYAGICFVLLVIQVVIRYRSRDEKNDRLTWWPVLFGAGLLLAGSFFYVRNWIDTGNPIHPGRLSLFGLTLFPGPWDPPAAGRAWGVTELYRKLVHDDTFRTGLKLPVSAFLWVGLLGNVGMLLSRYRDRVSFGRAAVTLIFPVAGAVMFFRYIGLPDPRHLFPVYLGLWFGLAGFFSDAIDLSGRGGSDGEEPAGVLGLSTRFWIRYGLLAIFLSLLYHTGLYANGAFWGGAGACAAGVYGWYEFSSVRRYGPWLAAAVAVITLGSVPFWYDAYRKTRIGNRRIYPSVYKRQGRAWLFLQRATAGEPADVSYAGTAMIYPLFGPDLENNVFYTPVHPGDDPKEIDLNNATPAVEETLHPRVAPDRAPKTNVSFWIERLEERDVEYVLLSGGHGMKMIRPELSMIRKRPDRFRVEAAYGASRERVREADRLADVPEGVYVFRFLGGR